MPVTPTVTPFGYGTTPFSYAGGFWPGMSIAQDPVTGQTFWTYTPVNTTAAMPTDTPTRGQRDQTWYPGA